ncbi:aldehyde ferredoxin oxidoreductase family protein [Halomarina halobia]|uniref:Aldehyde ferredoxin oxidoreductase family protein n=1 Tax=Halomarina halobia TaxID=3033386 RepID=A0ABD6AEL8_9EURY|nr:aldehyde ferredoxin oxidoreductase C-terminal domain-containing protein [Halomarina sp. PSR21]
MRHLNGPLLTVDVGDRTAERTEIDGVLEAFIGGRGVATKLAAERIPTDVDPFDPENRIYFTTGPMQASQMSFTGRMNATSVSPLTGGLLSSNAGGFLSRNFTATGVAAVEIVGASDEPIAIHVRDDGVEFEEVTALEGAEVSEVVEWAENEHDLGSEHTLCIGPAGENLVRFACVMTSESRAFGRGGLGAVLGSKNVKVVTFDGSASPSVEIPPEAMEIHRDAASSDHVMKRQGTASVVDLGNEVEAFPTRYFSERSFEGASKINGDVVESKKYKRGTCSACAFACKLPTRDEETGLETEGPEYETLMAFGGNCAIDDIVDIMRFNERCDQYGMDTISCGDTVAAYLASEDAFGDAELVDELVENIAHREGIGDTLAEGVARCHEELGVENWSVKGMEFPAHDGRALNGQGLSFATANRGADHMYATFYAYEYPFVPREEAFDPKGVTSEKAEKLVELENTRALEDCGVVCRFSRGQMTPERFSALLDAEWEELLEVGDRVVELERAFNNQRGFNRGADEDLPYELEGFEEGLDRYYEVRGWTEDGVVPGSDVGASGD